MATIKRFEDIEIWQIARKFDSDLFKIVESSKISRDFKLRDQMLGASGSIMDNIAEGFGRSGNREFGQFLYISKGSCIELMSQCYRAFDRNYINEEVLESCLTRLKEINNKIGSFAKYLSQSEIKGIKYQNRTKYSKKQNTETV